MKFHVALLSALLLAACARNEVMTSRFDPAEASFINKAGTGTVTGQAFMRTVGGEVRYGAGNEVTLIPSSIYAQERIGKIYGQGKCVTGNVKFDQNDPQYMAMVKKTKANGEGRFKFENLAAGNYFVVTTVIWGVPTQYGIASTGCGLYESVQVKDGQTSDIIMSGT